MGYKVGDKFVIEIEDIVDGGGGYKIKGFKNLVLSEYKLRVLDNQGEGKHVLEPGDIVFEDGFSGKYVVTGVFSHFCTIMNPGDFSTYRVSESSLIYAGEHINLDEIFGRYRKDEAC